MFKLVVIMALSNGAVMTLADKPPDYSPTKAECSERYVPLTRKVSHLLLSRMGIWVVASKYRCEEMKGTVL